MKFSLKDICNLDEALSYATGSNPHNMHLFLLHDHGFLVTAVFASNLQDALDEAVDQNQLDSFLIEEKDFEDYGVWTDEDSSAHLGNASEPFDIECLYVIEVSHKSFVDQLSALQIEA